jgi:putative hydrolase of the HAD superfamily
MSVTDTLIFDFGGVLVDLNMPACEAAFKALGIPKISHLLDRYKQKGFFLEFEEGKISTCDFFTQLQALAAIPVSVAQMETAYLAFLEEVPQKKLDLLLELRKNYRVLMLSNINAFLWQYCRKRFFESGRRCISDYFDKCYLSFEMGVCKPSPVIYEQMIAAEHLSPSQCLYLDDSLMNIEMGKQIGFRTYHAQAREDFAEPVRMLLKK